MGEGKIVAVSISDKKGMKKANVTKAILKENYGIVGDVHAGTENRQISVLAEESIKKMKAKGLDVSCGDFAENITTQGLDLLKLKIGDKLKINEALLGISQIGKTCHSRCNIYYQAGDCIMPREGIFARVLKDGVIRPGDAMEVVEYAKRTK